ncbi:NAD-dependent epimerase/dehydratase family protein [Micromonospora chersina]|uniref:NAD-dependent epimerase/dehydratase family protein n=1 Tax=Micromonospora chersina TaxID=47854 RepID=UPI00371B74A0
MKILVLGGTTFIGRAVVAAAMRDGHSVTLLNRGTNPIWVPLAEQLTADRADPSAVEKVLRGRSFDVTVDVSGTERAYIDSTAPVLRDGGLDHYVFISSGGVYDSSTTPRPFPERAPTPGDPVWGGYGAAKADCERRLAELGFPALTVLRPPYVYGPRNNEPREQFLWARILTDRPVYVPGDGSTPVQFCPVDHLAELALSAATGAVPAGTYNVGESRAYRLTEYVDLLAEVAGRPARVRYVTDTSVPARQYFPFRDYGLVLDTAAIERVQPLRAVPLRDGLTETLAWFRRHGQLPYTPTDREVSWETRR